MTSQDVLKIRELIRDIPDFPQPGILFKDITTLLKDGPGLKAAIKAMADPWRDSRIDYVVGMESRGFIFGVPLALELGVGFVPVRKVGKLPAETINVNYALEYGTATLKIHRDAIETGKRILIVDDLLATGGTVGATIELVERLGGEVVGLSFLVELDFLDGRRNQAGRTIESLIHY